MNRFALGVLAVLPFVLAGPVAAQSVPARGKAVFDRWCGACHAPNLPGQPMPGTTTLATKYGTEKPAALEQRTDLTADFVKFTVRHGVNAMPFTRKTEIDDADLNSLALYLTRNTKP